MTKEKIRELWDEACGESSHIRDDDHFRGQMEDLYTRKLLLECAKSVCINCKDGNESLPTKEPHRRIHKLTATWSESCRAPSFFLEDE